MIAIGLVEDGTFTRMSIVPIEVLKSKATSKPS